MADQSHTISLAGLGVAGGVLVSLLIEYLTKKKNPNTLPILPAEEVELQEDEEEKENIDVTRRIATSELIKLNKSKYKSFNRIKIKNANLSNNTLFDEIKFLDSAICEIEKIPNLIIDLELTNFEEIVNPITRGAPKDIFINTNSFILFYSLFGFTYSATAAFGPQSLMQNSKRWLRAGPRYHNYFQPERTKALIITQDGLCPGLNVVIREIVMNLSYAYKVDEIYGAKYGWKGIIKKDWVKLIPGQIKTIHHRGGSYLGTSRSGFNKEEIIDSLVKNGFNQLYVICGQRSMGNVLELYYEIRRQKLNIAICNIPRSIDNDIPIIDESFGYQSCVEEASRIIESAWVESRSHRNGVGLVRLMGQKSGYITLGACLASRCVNVALIPEFSYELNGKNGILEYVKQRLQTKGDCIIAVSEGANDSFKDVDQVPEDVGKFLMEQIVKYCHEENTEVTVKYFDPLYMIRAVKANAYDTKLCSTLGQNAVHSVMAGFTGFCIGHVHNKTCLIPLEEILSGNYSNRVSPCNQNWQRVLASTGQPSFVKEEQQTSRQA